MRTVLGLNIAVASITLASLVVAGCTHGSSGGGFGGSASVASTASGSNATPVSSGTATQAKPAPVRTAPANLATGPMLVLDTSGTGAFFDLPFPIDARRTNGAPDLSKFPNPLNKDFIKAIYALGSECSGYSPTGCVYFQFDGIVAPPVDDPLASVAPGSPVFIVDIDPSSPERLSLHPIHASVTQSADAYRPVNLVQLLPVPGLGLRTSTTYAAIVRRSLGCASGPFLGQCPGLTALLAGNAPSGVLGADLAQSYKLLPQALLDLGIHPDDLAAATVFTTGDPTAALEKEVAWAAAQPPLVPQSLATRNSYPGFTALKGSYGPPVYQQGTPPYLLGGGRLVVDAQGNPVTQWTDTAEFQLSIPTGRMPAAGFPLYFWLHGTGGEAKDIIDRGAVTTANGTAPAGSGPASYLAPRGWAASCAAGPLSPGRIGLLSLDGYASYNIFNPVMMRDTFLQSVLDQVTFRNMLLNMRIDPALCPGTDASASPDGKVRFDPSHMIVGGQSLGSYLAGMVAATLPGFQGAVLTGAGGSWVEFGFGPKSPIDLEGALELLTVPLGQKLDRFHPLITGFDLSGGPADNTHYLRHVLREPLAGHGVPHVLVVEGFKDLQVATGLQRALVLGLGIDFMGTDPGTTPDDQLIPVFPWSGRQVLPGPVSGNVTTTAGARTGVVVRYKEDGILEGHYVAFQEDAPKLQIANFASDLSAGNVPVVK